MAGFPISFLSDLVNRQTGDSSIYSLNKAANIADSNQAALMSLLDGLSNGETIIGKIMASSEGSIQILTGDNVLINAEISEGVSLKTGQTALFEVNKSADNHVSLRPLYQNTASEETAASALKQAGLPVNERTMEFVARSMEYGNPIDRNSLVSAYRDVALFPEAPVKYIVDLKQMNIPVNEANIEQYRAYLNMENSVSEAFTDISGSVSEEFAALTEEALSSLVSGEENTVNPGFSKALEFLGSLSEFAGSMEEIPGDRSLIDPERLASLKENLVKFTETSALDELTVSDESVDLSPAKVFKAFLTDTGNMLQKLSENGGKLPEGTDIQALKSLLTENLKDLLTRTFTSQWSLDTDKIGDKKEIRDLYERLFEQSGKLLTGLTENLGKDSPVTARVQTLSDNLQFMNSLNNFVPYVQIPFRGENGNNASELYVYKNKKSLSDGEGEISAFIHLDMESLGPTDVYVKLKDQAVSTKFTLKDDETLTLVHEHIDFLNKRLNEKGYSFSSEMITMKDPVPPITDMLLNKTDRIMVAKTKFDARV
ncbi:MAG: flagellar hook-length control protein FliK [Lachnospiraceae bacterium]|nr:flagellar hook-length control protein FliK [Lachnospiraceae bacterium]